MLRTMWYLNDPIYIVKQEVIDEEEENLDGVVGIDGETKRK